MKKILLLVSSFMLICASASAQGILRNLGERAKQAVENAVGEKVENAINNAVNRTGNKNDSNSGNDAAVEDAVETTANEAVDFAEIQAKSDFQRGANVFFNDDVTGEKLGEFPSKWDLLSGSEVEVVNITGKKAIKMEDSKIQPLMEEREYLPEDFTIEFDVLAQPAEEGSGWDGTLDLIFEDGTGRRVFDIRMSPEYHPYYGGRYNGIDWGWGLRIPTATKWTEHPAHRLSTDI